MNKLKRYQIHLSLIRPRAIHTEHPDGEWMMSKDVLSHNREQLRKAFDAGYLYCYHNTGAWVGLTMCDFEFERFLKTLEENQA